ncbi:major facilitator superfamily transporter [Apiospora arundinis]|uniref:Major facilitator superfamily transporter n=1 Tax=Apiospora arundinis TaxID=335852 RepID=A0ABR2IUG9_9PEZI
MADMSNSSRNDGSGGFAPPARTYQPPTADAYHEQPEPLFSNNSYTYNTPDFSRRTSTASTTPSSTAHPGTLVSDREEERDGLAILPPSRAPAPRPLSKDYPRPMTASTKRLSLTSWVSKRSIKYGAGKFARVELVPQPSDDPEDPLNWPMWRKNLNYLALVYMTALIGVLKTIFVSVNGPIAIRNGVSYTAAVALTGVPLMVSALTGALSLVVARLFGKRPVYLVSTAFLWIGVVWGSQTVGSFGQNMASRVFQGIGWGAFETLVLGSLQDTFFEHELEPRIIITNVIAVATTWGGPLLGGVASAGAMGFAVQYQILNAFLAIGVLLMIFGAPETAFDQVAAGAGSPLDTTQGQGSRFPSVNLSLDALKRYMDTMKPWSYETRGTKLTLALQVPRAMVAPTVGLVFVVTLLPQAALWSFASALSMFFSVMPYMASTGAVGALLTGPALLAPGVIGALGSAYFLKRFTPKVHVGLIGASTVLVSIGLLGFGLYVSGGRSQVMTAVLGNDFSARAELSFPAVSFLLALLAVGAMGLESTARPMIQRSTAYTSSNLAIGLRNSTDMNGGLVCWRNFVVGAFIAGIPNAIWAADGLKSVALGMGITQIFLAIAVAAVWWVCGTAVLRLDGRVMGAVDLNMLGKQVSFFDTD